MIKDSFRFWCLVLLAFSSFFTVIFADSFSSLFGIDEEYVWVVMVAGLLGFLAFIILLLVNDSSDSI